MPGFVVGPGGGHAFDWHGARVVIKARGADTVGQMAVMESTYPSGLAVPEHHHDGEDELFYLLEGELEGFCGGDRWTATPGSFVLIPRDQPHGFVVTSGTTARALVIVGPPHLDEQVAATGVAVTNEPGQNE
jgi:quercetin dioxygenase-like cupin family protein